MSLLEERRLRNTRAGQEWEDACDATDTWIHSEGELGLLTDPGAANRWKALGGAPDGEDKEDLKHARSLHLSSADQTRLREAVAAAGNQNSEYVLDLIAGDDTPYRRDS